MYRQILINPTDRRYQLILWRSNPSHPIKIFCLNTVTYGTSSAPYLATRCLQHLATLNKPTSPLGAQALQDDFYVDDGLTGSDDINTAIEIQSQLKKILSEAGLKLRKWCSNHPQLLKGIPLQDQEVNLDLNTESSSSIKTLGLTWIPQSDKFCIKTQMASSTSITKRVITADLARIFDPLGILGPVVVTAKIFIQQLWETNLSWDEELSKPLKQTWVEFRRGVNTLNNATFSRHVFNSQVPLSRQLHVFVDASERAYGAAVYLRSTDQQGIIRVQLLCAKSRVAPIKKQTLPRLELCAAVLGAEITTRVIRDLKLHNEKVILWTDSEIVLSWINSSTAIFHTFVANRIAKIQELTIQEQWRHVRSKDNPADILSRGLQPEAFMSCNQWFYGPLFLHGKESLWPGPWSKELVPASDIEQKKPKVTSASITEANGITEFIYTINHRNSFKFLLRVIAYINRFRQHATSNRAEGIKQLALSTEELNSALLIVVKNVQKCHFKEEIKQLQQDQNVNKSIALSSLAPFLDNNGIIRVGGRLQASNLAYDTKHPMLLPYNDQLVKLLFQREHEDNKHCGPQALLATIRQRFWPIKGKYIARNVVQNCVRCVRAKPELFNQVMGNLPAERVTESRPFLNTGIDYCGPFWVHYKIRGKKPHKSYLVVFCCFATKAVHFELVTDLTTETFIGALKRFIGRRGRCQNIFCDNATNFVGAKRQLEELNDVIHSDTAREKIIKISSDKGINFKFIPPRSPNFGGLWEAAVKSAKHLLLRSVSTASLTYEELETVVIEVEAILNSRPLTPASSDPNDLMALTPGHFLIGEPLTAQSDTRISPTNSTLASRWRLVSQLKHEFWTRWSQEYLHQLQCRHKWTTRGQTVKEGDMVLIREENSPALKWPLGRILHLYPGNDGLVRVADVKTSSGVWKRSIRHLAPLPIENTISELPTEEMSETSQVKQGERLPKETRKKRKVTHHSLLVTLMVALLLLPVVISTPINVTKFSNAPGIFFEGIGTTKFVSGDWKMLVYYNITPIRLELEAFDTGTETLQNLCRQLQHHLPCHNLAHHFSTIKADLAIDAKLFTRRRVSRAAFDIIGNVANKLFGVLDSDYAEQMSDKINMITNNEQFLMSMLKNQTSVIDSTINIIKDNTAITTAKINSLVGIANTLTKDFAEVNSYITRIEFLTLLTTQLSIMATKLQQIETAILNVLTDTQHGKISPLLLSPQQLKLEIINIKNHLTPPYQLPLSQDDLIHFYKLMTAEAGITENHVVFLIRIPLVEQAYFDLFRPFPIPALINGTLLTVEPETQVLAMSPYRDQYVPMTLDDLKTCIQLKETSRLCFNKQQKFQRASRAVLCTVSLFNNETASACNLQQHHENILWTPLVHNNQWIYAVKQLTQLTAVCGAETIPLDLEGSGTLALQPDCTLKNNLITIQGHQVVKNVIYKSYVAVGDLIAVGKPEHINNIFYSNTLNNSEKNAQLTQLQETLKNQNLAQLPNTLQIDRIHHSIIGYLALIGVIMLTIWTKCTCQKRTTKDTTTTNDAAIEHQVTEPNFEVHVT